MKKSKLIIFMLFFVCLSCQNQTDTGDGNEIQDYDAEEYDLRQIETKLFLEFSPRVPFLGGDWEIWISDWEKWIDLIYNHATLKLYYANGAWAFLESKDGKPIPPSTIELLLENPLVGSASYPFEFPFGTRKFGDLQGFRNVFVAKLKDSTSFVQLQQLAEQNNCIIGEEDDFAKNQFFLTISKSSLLDAKQLSKLFYETDLFEYVEATFVIINIPGVSFCDHWRIIKELKDEPAYVRKGCFEHLGSKESFYFEFPDSYYRFEFLCPFVCPIVPIPSQFRKEGLKVNISGHIFSCQTGGGCSNPDMPDTKHASTYFFELTSIKTTIN